MKQQMLEAEVKDLKHSLDMANLCNRMLRQDYDEAKATIDRQAKEMARMQIEIEVLKAKVPTVGRGPQGASIDREMRNGQPNGFVPPTSSARDSLDAWNGSVAA